MVAEEMILRKRSSMIANDQTWYRFRLLCVRRGTTQPEMFQALVDAAWDQEPDLKAWPPAAPRGRGRVRGGGK